MPVKSGYMLSAGLSEFTVNSAFYGYYSAGLLQAIINDSMVSSPERVRVSKQDNSSLVEGFKQPFNQIILLSIDYFSGFILIVLKGLCFVISDTFNLSCAPKHQLNGAFHSSGEFIYQGYI